MSGTGSRPVESCQKLINLAIVCLPMRPALASQQREAKEFQRATGHKLERSLLRDPALLAVLVDAIDRIAKFDKREIRGGFCVAGRRNALLRHLIPHSRSDQIQSSSCGSQMTLAAFHGDNRS